MIVLDYEKYHMLSTSVLKHCVMGKFKFHFQNFSLIFFKPYEIQYWAIFLQYKQFLVVKTHYQVIFEKLYLVKLSPNFVGSNYTRTEQECGANPVFRCKLAI